MFKNFFTLAIRNLFKRKLFSFINIFGLAAGVAACLVIMKYIDFETSYDNFHENGPHLYRITRKAIQNGEERFNTITTTYGLGPALVTDFPEIKRYIRLHPMYNGAVLIYQPATGEPLAFHETGIQMVDSTFLRAFSFKAISGDPATSLDDPNSIVIMETIAKKYFGQEDPIGKTIKISGGWCDGDYNVTAVLKDIPDNSHFTINVLVPTHNLLHNNRQYQNDNGWDWNNWTTYVELHDQARKEDIASKLPAFTARVIDSRHKESGVVAELSLQPVSNIHLNPGLKHDDDTISHGTIYFFATIAAFILFIAWINYINLSTATNMERAREVGIKKSIGAYKSQLVSQFLMESMLINFLGITLAMGLAVLLLPVLADIIGKKLFFDFSDPRLWLTLVGLFIFGSFASGAYPSLALSSFKTTEVLKGRAENRGFSLRKVLVVFQFGASLILIAGTFVVYRQIRFMQSQDKGLQMDQMLIVSGPRTIPYKESKKRLTLFKEELKKIPGVAATATSAAIPGGGHNWGADIRRNGSDQKSSRGGSVVWIDPDFIPAYEIPFIAGKNFNPSIKSEMQSVIINEASLEAFGLGTAEEALNEQLLIGGDTVAILGVLKNYNWNSLKSEHIPFLFLADTITGGSVSIHLEGPVQSSVEAIGKLYKELVPGDPYRFYFLDDFFNEQYKSDQQFGEIFGMFAILAVVIACLGLWGLASFTTSQRMKEIGVRKVLGASGSSIVYLLSGQFLKLVFISAIIALPLAGYGIYQWLQGFAFRVGLQWDLFVIPVVILAGIALATVSLQVIRGASTNPAAVLRSE